MQIADQAGGGAQALDLIEAARRLGVGRSSVYGLIKEGRLQARKVGRRTVVTEVDIQRCLTELPTINPASLGRKRGSR